MSAEIRFEVTPDKEDYRSAEMHDIWLHSVLGYLMMGSAFGVGAGTVGGFQQGVAYGLAWGAIAPISGFISQFSSAASRARMPDALSPTSYILSEDSITISAPTNVAHTKWSEWHKAVESKRVIALRSVAGLLQVFPKRQLSEDTIGEVKGLLRRALNGRVKFRGGT